MYHKGFLALVEFSCKICKKKKAELIMHCFCEGAQSLDLQGPLL